jgi:hypothetical protein
MRDPLRATSDWDPPLIQVMLIYLERNRVSPRSRGPDITVPLFFPFFPTHILLPHLRQWSVAAAARDVQLRFWLPEVLATLWRSPDD